MKCIHKFRTYPALVVLIFLAAASLNKTQAQSNLFSKDRFEIIGKYHVSTNDLGLDEYTIASKPNYAFELQFAYYLPVFENVQLGLGVGLTGFHNPAYNTLPLDLKLVYQPFEKAQSLELQLGIGYAVEVDESFEKGYRGNVGVGWLTPLGKKNKLGISLGYAQQKFDGSVNGNITSQQFYFGLFYRI